MSWLVCSSCKLCSFCSARTTALCAADTSADSSASDRSDKGLAVSSLTSLGIRLAQTRTKVAGSVFASLSRHGLPCFCHVTARSSIKAFVKRSRDPTSRSAAPKADHGGGRGHTLPAGPMLSDRPWLASWQALGCQPLPAASAYLVGACLAQPVTASAGMS
jgi:hypothetical protein